LTDQKLDDQDRSRVGRRQLGQRAAHGALEATSAVGIDGKRKANQNAGPGFSFGGRLFGVGCSRGIAGWRRFLLGVLLRGGTSPKEHQCGQ
jgi:hypothetical protein